MRQAHCWLLIGNVPDSNLETGIEIPHDIIPVAEVARLRPVVSGKRQNCCQFCYKRGEFLKPGENFSSGFLRCGNVEMGVKQFFPIACFWDEGGISHVSDV